MKNNIQGKAQIVISFLLTLEKVLRQVNVVIVAVCGIILFLFMFMVVSDVTGRYLFLKPVPATTEVGSTVLAFVIFLGLALTMANKKHVKVEILINHLPRRWQFWLELFALVLCFIVVFSIVWYSLPFLISSVKIKEVYLTWGFPQYYAKGALFVGALLFAIQILIMFVNQLLSRVATVPVNMQENIQKPPGI